MNTMETLFVYALKSALCLSMLYVPYQLVLRRESFFRLNRWVLLSILAASLVLPLFSLPLTYQQIQPLEPGAVVSVSTVARLVEVKREVAQTVLSADRLFRLAAALWLTGTVVLLLLRGASLVLLLGRIRRGCLWQSLLYNAKVYCHVGQEPSYSWMHSVVISEYDYEHHRREVLAHELAHVDHLHSCDNLLMAVTLCLQWFNPFAWMLADSLSEVHEFEADAAVLAEGVDRVGYQLLLLNKAVPASRLTMANGFGHARLKSRFQMMLRSESSRWSWLRVLLLLPVLVLTAVLLADAKARIKYQWPTHTEAISTVSVAPTTTAVPTASSTDRLSAPKAQHQTTAQLPPEPQPSHPANRVVTAPSQMAQFPGGNAALRDYMRSHLPALDQSGGVVLRLTIAADGRIRQAEVLRSGGAEADEAAISMVSGMPCWIPGRQDGQVCTSTYTLPVSFDD